MTAASPLAGIRLLLFDMDGVLVDVSRSYRQAVTRTVDRYVSHVARKPELAGRVTPAVIQGWKATGGWNNDWDLSAGLAGALLTGAPDLGAAGSAPPSAAARAAVRYHGDLSDPHDIKRIFQEIYLGGPAFQVAHGLRPAHHEEAGLCELEEAILSPGACPGLAERWALGIATGRPQDEASEALRRLGTAEHFQAVVTHDDVVAESRRTGTPVALLSKPFGWPVAEVARRIEPGAPFAYVGDLPDDMAAAAAAGGRAIGVAGGSAERRAALLAAGAAHVVDHPDELG